MHKLLCDERGEAMVDYVGKLDNFKHDVSSVLERLGIEQTNELQKLNSSVRIRGVGSLYNDADIDYLYRVYDRDFDEFGYTVSDVI